MSQTISYRDSAINNVDNFVYRATAVTDVNKEKIEWATDVIGGATDSATRCGGSSISSSSTDPWTTWTHATPASASNLCDELSMDQAKQGYKDNTFTIQATVKPAASADEAAAVALLAAFKTASVSMQGGI